ncbi:Uncharacterised protein [Mycobacterium tuberculosis]|uniref:Uncharacterized protein n=1 Tax=Mycobacterium tuberculosis TaxID=1773 RepID=A0A916LC51_MYCTX|nr:Uncharacterised protein [Mycobacterium tuberculosis]
MTWPRYSSPQAKKLTDRSACAASNVGSSTRNVVSPSGPVSMTWSCGICSRTCTTMSNNGLRDSDRWGLTASTTWSNGRS